MKLSYGTVRAGWFAAKKHVKQTGGRFASDRTATQADAETSRNTAPFPGASEHHAERGEEER